MRFRESSELELGEYSKLVVINEDAKSLDDHFTICTWNFSV